MTKLPRHESLCGTPIDAFVAGSIADEQSMVTVLDDAIPLQGASHADVAEYVVETPMRYAECFARLTDDRKVRLQDPCAFVGWCGHGLNRSLLFRSNDRHYEIAVEARLRGHAPGGIRAVFLDAGPENSSSAARKFIGIEGDVVILPELPARI